MSVILATHEIEAGGLHVQDLSVLHREFRSSLGNLDIEKVHGCNLATEHLTSICKVLGLIPSTPSFIREKSQNRQ